MKKRLLSRALFGRLLRVTSTQLLLALFCSSLIYAKTPSDRNSLENPSASAADRTLTGRVTDEKEQSLPGVSVLLKGSQRGTVTDADGRYRLDVPETNAVLVFSFVGYVSQEVRVGSQSSINLSLKADDKTLNEIVVIGYGTSRKSDLTGAVAGVKEA